VNRQDSPAGADVSTTLLIPVYNERACLPALCERSRKVLEGTGASWEILFVDDGSRDGSAEWIRRSHQEDGRIRALFLRANFGQHAALSAGLEHARGEVVVLMDGDLQFDPEDIPRLIGKLGEGYDLVGGWRADRRDPSLRRRLPSAVVNAVLGWATGVKLRDYNCGFKVFRREVALRVNRQGELRRYLAPLLAMLSPRVTEVPVAHHPRCQGASKYTLARSLRLLGELGIAMTGAQFASLSRQQAAAWKALCRLSRGLVPRGRGAARGRGPLFEIRERLPAAPGSDRP